MRVEVGHARLAERWSEQMRALYVAVFSRPPFVWSSGEDDRFAGRLSNACRTSEFGVGVASEKDGELAGFAYGVPVPQGAQTAYLPATWVSGIDAPVFHVYDFAVACKFRGIGIGKRIHDALLASRREGWATLTVQSSAVATAEIYRHWGWQLIGSGRLDETGSPWEFDAYAYYLKG